MAAAALLVAGLVSTDARSFAAAPIIVAVEAPKPIRLRVASGHTLPCDSSTNVPLFEGVVRPHTPLSIANEAVCACWQQTDPEFPRNGWSAPNLLCRPVHCATRRHCTAEMDRPLRITVR